MRTQHQWRIALLSSFIALTVMSCRGGERPFLQVQFCLTEAAGADELKRVLREIARDEGMEFGDRSAETNEELRSMENSLSPEVRQSFPIINVGVRRGDIGVGGGNLGLGPNQVALGFSRDTPAGRNFAKRAVQRLQQTWKLVKVPNDRGAFPLKDCPTDV